MELNKYTVKAEFNLYLFIFFNVSAGTFRMTTYAARISCSRPLTTNHRSPAYSFNPRPGALRNSLLFPELICPFGILFPSELSEGITYANPKPWGHLCNPKE